MASPGWVGRPVRRREDAALLRGEAAYVDDLVLPGMAHMVAVRSPEAHATLVQVEVAAARRAPGVLAVLTAADLAGHVAPMPVMAPDGAEVAETPIPLLATGRVRFAGEPVAVVVAETRAAAKDAAEIVAVDYDPLPVLVDPHAALGSPVLLHQAAPGNVLLRWARRHGDVDAAFGSAAHRVRGSFSMPRLVAAPIEPRGAVAAYDAAEDLLTLWLSAQDPHRPLRNLTAVLRRPAERCRLVVRDVGGAFGSKGALAPEAAVAAVAAMRLGRPVKWVEERWENFQAAYQGRGQEIEAELALDGAGRFLALRARTVADLGAYLYPGTAAPPVTSAMLLTGAYDVPAVDVEVVGAATNKVPTGPYRGAGRPEGAYVAECRAEQRDARAVGRLVGVGLCVFVERAGAGLWESGSVAVAPDGRVLVRTGSTPHGQGHATTFAQIAADALGLSPDQVEVETGDTRTVPRGMGTYASRSVTTGGSAVYLAAQEVGRKAARVAAWMLGVAPEEVRLQDGGPLAAPRGGRGRGWRPVAAARRPRTRARRAGPLRAAGAGVPVRGIRDDRGDRPGHRAARGRAAGRRGRRRPDREPAAGQGAGGRLRDPGRRPGAVRGGRLRRRRAAADRQLHGLRAAHGRGDPLPVHPARLQGTGGERRDRRPRRDSQRRGRRPRPARRPPRRPAVHARAPLAHPQGPLELGRPAGRRRRDTRPDAESALDLEAVEGGEVGDQGGDVAGGLGDAGEGGGQLDALAGVQPDRDRGRGLVARHVALPGDAVVQGDTAGVVGVRGALLAQQVTDGDVVAGLVGDGEAQDDVAAVALEGAAAQDQAGDVAADAGERPAGLPAGLPVGLVLAGAGTEQQGHGHGQQHGQDRHQ